MTSTPQELYAALDVRRRERSPWLAWWRVAEQMGVPLVQLHRLARGDRSPVVRRAALRWLEQPAADQAFSRIRENVQTGQEG